MAHELSENLSLFEPQQSRVKSTKPRTHHADHFSRVEGVFQFGLTAEMVAKAVDFVYATIDVIDAQLIRASELRLAQMLELANLSAVVGNLFRAGLCRSSGGSFIANGPHKYPDILGKGQDCHDIEIKVALEKNSPKGHLAKPGPHITLRYVLCNQQGVYVPGKENRGPIPWIWEVRVGTLRAEHFGLSNTEGDSGKTAVVNKAGMDNLKIAYFDSARCPLGRRARKSIVGFS